MVAPALNRLLSLSLSLSWATREEGGAMRPDWADGTLGQLVRAGPMRAARLCRAHSGPTPRLCRRGLAVFQIKAAPPATLSGRSMQGARNAARAYSAKAARPQRHNSLCGAGHSPVLDSPMLTVYEDRLSSPLGEGIGWRRRRD